jgi:hypothetical protein
LDEGEAIKQEEQPAADLPSSLFGFTVPRIFSLQTHSDGIQTETPHMWHSGKGKR